MIDRDRLKKAWEKEVIRGRNAEEGLPFFEALDSVGSTNDRAAALAASGAPEYTLVTADRQTAGKGRRGRVWETPEGAGLAMSLVLRPRVPLASLSQLTVLAGIAVFRRLAAAGISPCIKWPNDIRIGGRKLCGILAETVLEGSRADYTVLGIGINMKKAAYSEEVAGIAVSLEEAGVYPAREDLMAAITGEIMDLVQKWEESENLSFIIAEYERSMEWKGEICRVISADGRFTEGKVLGLAADGRLRFLTEEGEEKIGAGEVSLRRE